MPVYDNVSMDNGMNKMMNVAMDSAAIPMQIANTKLKVEGFNSILTSVIDSCVSSVKQIDEAIAANPDAKESLAPLKGIVGIANLSNALGLAKAIA